MNENLWYESEAFLSGLLAGAKHGLVWAWTTGPTVCVGIVIVVWLVANFTQNLVSVIKSLSDIWFRLWRVVRDFFGGVKLLFVGGTDAVVQSYKEHQEIVEKSRKAKTKQESSLEDESKVSDEDADDIDPFDVINEAFGVKAEHK